jgi:hypothetical protein
MATQSFVRGATVSVTINFFDSGGGVINPVSATLDLDYPMSDGTRGQTSAALTNSGNDWTYDWDSTVAAGGKVYGHAATDGSAPISAVDFQFNLTANLANPGS